jgi:hypothetical protein
LYQLLNLHPKENINTMAQQTAVDWLVNKIYMIIPNEERNFLEGLREQAKAMEKEQLNIARLDGINLANKGYGK